MPPGTSSRAPAGSARGPFLSRRRTALALALLLAGGQGRAWGERGHRLASQAALSTLPGEVRSWFKGREPILLDHASDPDRWKTDRKEGPRHFINVERYGGPEAVPASFEAARGLIRGDATRAGLLPWVIQDRWRDLVAAFREGKPEEVALAASILGHYIADAQVPLHTTLHHDGREPGQKGLHARWESGLVGRLDRLDGLKAAPAHPVADFPARPWQWIRESHARVPLLLADDLDADRTTPLGPEGPKRTGAYWSLFKERQGPVVERQLALAATRLGEGILAAWIEAGRPPAP